MNDTRRLLVQFAACFALLVAATFVVYGHATLALWQGRTPGQFDVRHFFVPLGFLYDFALEHGKLPEWNPFSFAGTPFAANPQAAVFYPPHFLRSLLTATVTPLNTYYGLVVLVVLQAAGAGAGAYMLARSYKLSHPAAFAAALIFAFGVCLTRRVVALQFASALVWVPFLVIGLRRMLAAKNALHRAFYCCGCGLLLGVSVLSGFVHIHTYAGVMLAGYWIGSRVLGIDRGRGTMPRMMAADTVSFAGLFVIAALVSAAMLLPAAEFGSFTNRSGEITPNLGEPDRSVAQVVGAILGPAGRDAAEPERGMGYRTAGLSVFLLAFVGLLGGRRRAALLHVLVFLALLDCTFGPPFPLATVVEYLNPFRMVAPSRAFVVANLPLAIAAGFGVDAVAGFARDHARRLLRTATVVAGCVALVVLSRNPLTDLAVQLTFFLAVAIVAAHWISMPRLAGAIACIVIFAECLVWNYRCLPVILDKAEFINIRSHDTPVAPDWTENARTADPAPNAHLYSLDFVVNGYDPLYIRDVWNLFAPPFQLWNYDRILRATDVVRENPRTHLLFKRHFWLVQHVANGPMPAPDRFFPPTTTAFSRSAETMPLATMPVDEVPATPVSERVERVRLAIDERASEVTIPDAPPDRLHRVLNLTYRAGCPGQLRVWMIAAGVPVPVLETRIDAASPGDVPLTVPLPDTPDATIRLVFEPRTKGCTIEWRSAELAIDHADENGLIDITARSFNSVRVEVGPLDSERLLVFLDAQYPGWTARIDGQPTDILLVDNAFKGVFVGPGRHTVEFRYRSGSLRRGMAVSTITLLFVCGALAWFAVRRGRR